ncbi:MAG TPA: hypothetical protein VFW64_22290 [Pseudonocardiaceae bacterium]|nr:hypothetical protein [Pseudonocardiaceae bacterium]
MSQTPIYDQIRGERINVDLPAAGSEPTPVDPPDVDTPDVDTPDKGGFPVSGAGPAVFARPLDVAADRAADWSWFAAADPAVQAAANATRRKKP